MEQDDRTNVTPGAGAALRGARLGGLIALALAVGGCGVINSLFGDGALFGGDFEVVVTTVAGFNLDFPLAVELVIPYDKAAAGALPATAAEWFDQREALLSGFPAGAVDSRRWEWTPGQRVATQTVYYRVGARSPVLYVDYENKEGAHRQVLDFGSGFTLVLDVDGFEVRPLR